jgi:hypothetical protein
MAFQVADAARKRQLNRAEHVWTKRRGGQWVCVLCGAVIKDGIPPNVPTPVEWMPDLYVRLSDEDRARCPFEGS